MRDAEKLKLLESMPDTATVADWRAEVGRQEAMPDVRSLRSLKFGQLVCTVAGNTTGRYLGFYGGKHLVGWVSAMSNDLCVGEVAAGIPRSTTPVPSDDALRGMCAGLSSGYGDRPLLGKSS
jgi:hypothetical protein